MKTTSARAARVSVVCSLILGLLLPSLADARDARRRGKPPATKQGGPGPGAQPWVQVPRAQVAEECGLDPSLMARVDLQLTHTPFTIVRYGKLCWTGGYPGGWDQPYQVWSITKTMGALLVGMVAYRSSLDDTDPITDWIPRDQLGNINPEAKIAHVLAMTSTKPDLSYGNKGAWSYDTFGDREINVLVGVMNRAIAQEPQAFPGVSNIKEFAEKELFAPLGMRDSSWPGQSIAGTLVSSQEDLARLGLLILRRGVWAGERLLGERFVYRMTHPAFEDTNTGYGYLTYSNADKGWTYSTGTADTKCSPYVTWPSYPHAPFREAKDDLGGSPFGPAKYDVGLTWAAGAGGQRISVHRGLDLIITTRDDAASIDGDQPGAFEGHKRVWSLIRPALVELDPRFQGDEAAFCEAYRQSSYAPDLLDPWSRRASGPYRNRSKR